jgi:hypothetical protein
MNESATHDIFFFNAFLPFQKRPLTSPTQIQLNLSLTFLPIIQQSNCHQRRGSGADSLDALT